MCHPKTSHFLFQVQTGLGADTLSKSNLTFLVAPFSRMEQGETKTFCLNKMKLIVEAMEH